MTVLSDAKIDAVNSSSVRFIPRASRRLRTGFLSRTAYASQSISLFSLLHSRKRLQQLRDLLGEEGEIMTPVVDPEDLIVRRSVCQIIGRRIGEWIGIRGRRKLVEILDRGGRRGFEGLDAGE